MSGTPNYDTSVLKSDFGGGADFVHRDYTEARKAGFTNEQIMSHLDDNPDLLINKNVPGGGGLYDEIKSNLSGPCIDVWCVGGVGGFGRKLGAAFLCFGAMSKSSGQKYPQHKCKLH